MSSNALYPNGFFPSILERQNAEIILKDHRSLCMKNLIMKNNKKTNNQMNFQYNYVSPKGQELGLFLNEIYLDSYSEQLENINNENNINSNQSGIKKISSCISFGINTIILNEQDKKIPLEDNKKTESNKSLFFLDLSSQSIFSNKTYTEKSVSNKILYLDIPSENPYIKYALAKLNYEPLNIEKMNDKIPAKDWKFDSPKATTIENSSRFKYIIASPKKRKKLNDDE